MKTETGRPKRWTRAALPALSAIAVACLLAACGSSSSSGTKLAADTGIAKKCPSLGLFTWEGEAPASLRGRAVNH